ncbi:conserved hypothetical protein [Crenothrix polyspora]|uniref:DUF2281 domain-containing protein n=1 Tax=Crenothrix polyspora TaxID=360316 RepID=A0A1R4GZP9_9GAMM|nr:hypothetical protein [Crenothrix polyspora]SJM89488.1 conserved hypothetical protein [Crenothrix polyspora]
MYTAIKAIYENGQIIFQEQPPTTKKTNVIVMFIKDEPENVENQHKGTSPERQPGSLLRLGAAQNKTYNIPDDFNDPLDDLKEYME